MKKQSIWLENVKSFEHPKLKGDINVDILIIGGGITGITAAYYLKDEKLKIALVDRNLVGHGVTSKTTGKLNYLQGIVYSKLEQTFSFEASKLYYESQKEAISEVKRIIDAQNIMCDFEQTRSYLFVNNEKQISKLKKEKETLEKMKVKVQEEEKAFGNLPQYTISVADTAVFHPLKYIQALEKTIESKISIFEHTPILKIKKEEQGFICFTDTNTIVARKVILACHYPYFLIPFYFPLKTYIEKSYVSASKISKNKKETGITCKSPTKSFRYHQEKEKIHFIYLTHSHTICNHLNNVQNFQEHIEEVNKMDLEIDYLWSNDDVMTSDLLPFIGRMSKKDPDLFLATGYNTWGMTNGTIAGKIISDLILGRKTPYEDLFSPTRKINGSKLLQYPVNVYCNMKGFIESKMKINKPENSKKVRYEKREDAKIAIYTDQKGEHIVYTRCPHLGCSLLFNEIEKTWDCPCHASRFDVDGKCIKGPSNYNISYQKKEKF